MPAIQNAYNWIKTMLIKPVSELTTPELLAVIAAPDKDEVKRELLVMRGRAYHAGDVAGVLTDRLKQFLGDAFCGADDFTLNFTAMVNNAVSERLMLKEMEFIETRGTASESVETDLQKQWFAEWWRKNRLGFHQADIHEAAVSEGEYFAIIDFDSDGNNSRITPHKRYISTDRGGDGSGVVMVYPGGNISQKPLYALKRWQEKEGKDTVDYIAAYLPDREILFRKSAIGWNEIGKTSLINPRTGQPLGIPVVHYKMPGLTPEGRKAWAVQRLLNKLIIDLIIESDQNAFRIFKFFGWKPYDKNGALAVNPGSFIGSEKAKANEASMDAIPAADLASQDATIDSFIVKMAQLTDTPASRFQSTGQVAAEGTLKQQEAPLLKKCERRAEGLAIAWEDAVTIARRWHNAFADFSKSDFGILDESVIPDFKWQPFYTETDADRLAEAQTETAKITNITLRLNGQWISQQEAAVLDGYTPEKFSEMQDQRIDEAQSGANQLARALNTGNF